MTSLALLTDFIPAAFLVAPMCSTLGHRGVPDNPWALSLAMATIASHHCLRVLEPAGDKLCWRLGAAVRMDGATPLQFFGLVCRPRRAPSRLAVGSPSLLLACSECHCAFVLGSNDDQVTWAVALGHFPSADGSPRALRRVTGRVHALPQAATGGALVRHRLCGLAAGAVRS